MKASDNFFTIWGGIAGCQHLLAATVPALRDRGIALARIAHLLATNAARRFGLEGKGEIAVGTDADFSWGFRQEGAPLPRDRVRYRHPASLWDHHPLRWRVAGTALRGTVIARDGRIVGEPRGRFVRPGNRVSQRAPSQAIDP